MRQYVWLWGMGLLVAVGCADKKQASSEGVGRSSNQSVLDVTAPPSRESAPAPYTPPSPSYSATPAPVAVEPTPVSTATGSTYTVKKGDTLYSIAKARYGDGKQWKRLADANPGVNPQALKVGTNLVVP